MAAKQSQSAKGNPASKRMMNEKRKAKRVQCWAAAQRRKAINIANNLAAFKANEAFRERGEPTPYEVRQRARKGRA